MIADDIAAALPELRAHAESLMVDTCTVTRVSDDPPVWDGVAGTYTPAPPVVVYQGRCQLPKVNPSAQDADAGETNWAKGIVLIKLPMTAAVGEVGDPLAVSDGHDVAVTSRGDLTLSVRFTMPQTFEKSRKVSCQAVSRDA